MPRRPQSPCTDLLEIKPPSTALGPTLWRVVYSSSLRLLTAAFTEAQRHTDPHSHAPSTRQGAVLGSGDAHNLDLTSATVHSSPLEQMGGMQIMMAHRVSSVQQK